jgi:serine protein kinase
MKGDLMDKMMNEQDFRKVILSQRKKGKSKDNWEGTVLQYLEKVQETPDIATFAPGRVYNMIMKHGTSEVDPALKTQGYEDLVQYNFFKDKIFGDRPLEALHDLLRFMKAASRRTETGKRILLMMGPVSSGKSTIASLVKKGLEADDTLKFAIKGCPIHEEPLHLVPEEDRPFWEEQLGVKIEGFLCPHCQQVIDENYTSEEGVVKWEEIPVEQIHISEQRRICIGTFQPSDPKSQDVTELIGRVNMAKIARYGETDPRGYQFDGELQVANGGLIEYIEILKADIKFHYVLISAAQEQLIKAPGFPQMYVDSLILSHTNQTEFDSFRAEKKNEALHDRMYVVRVPWNLKVSEEIKIYKKMIAESDFRGIHIAPHTLRIAAEFAVLSRLKKSTKCTSLVQKMKLYDGEVSTEFKKTEIDVKALREEGKKMGEGMDGISPRFIINALNVALGRNENPKAKFKDGKKKIWKGCVNPIDLIRTLKHNFEHQVGIKDEDIKHYLNILMADKQSVVAEYKETAKKEVNKGFLYAYDEQAQELHNRYMENCEAYCKKEKVLDSVTQEYSDPDEKLMRSLEELIGIPAASKDTFRNGIFVHKATALENKEEFKFDSYAPLREAIEKKLMSDLKNVVNLSIATPSNTNPKAKTHRNKAMRTLMEKGYCENCANMVLAFVGEIMRKT